MIFYTFGTDKRDKPLNMEFFYPVVITNYKGKIYVSVSNKYYDIVVNSMKNINLYELSEEKIINILKRTFSNALENFEVKIMYKMHKNSLIDIEKNIAVPLNNDTKKYFMNTGKKSHDTLFKEEKWKQMNYIIDNEMVFIVPKNDKIVSMAYTSDIYGEGANIVVSTNEKYRNNGYGKDSVTNLTNAIIKKGLLPIYFVNKENNISIKLAKSLGYENMATEIVLCVNK